MKRLFGLNDCFMDWYSYDQISKTMTFLQKQLKFYTEQVYANWNAAKSAYPHTIVVPKCLFTNWKDSFRGVSRALENSLDTMAGMKFMTATFCNQEFSIGPAYITGADCIDALISRQIPNDAVAIGEVKLWNTSAQSMEAFFTGVMEGLPHCSPDSTKYCPQHEQHIYDISDRIRKESKELSDHSKQLLALYVSAPVAWEDTTVFTKAK
jgi:hypothetical protein